MYVYTWNPWKNAWNPRRPPCRRGPEAGRFSGGRKGGLGRAFGVIDVSIYILIRYPLTPDLSEKGMVSAHKYWSHNFLQKVLKV